MRRSMSTLVFALDWLATTASPAGASGLLVGAAEDGAKQPDFSVAKAKMDLAAFAGLDAIRVTALWHPGRTSLGGYPLLVLRNAAAAANLDGIRLIVSIYPTGSRATPRTGLARHQFAQFAASIARQLPTVKDFIVGNEPNLNRF